MLRLADSTPLVIRPLLASDRTWLAAAVAEMSPESRYQRFLSAMRTLPEPLLVRLVDTVDGVNHVALIAVINPGDADLEARAGVARYLKLPAEPGVAEFAIAVMDLAQGKGLGTILATALVDHARANGVTHFNATVAATNKPSLSVLRGLGTFVRQDLMSPGILELRIELAPDRMDR